MTVRSWEELSPEGADERHVVQLYRDADFLREAVAAWLSPALASGGGAILVARPEHAALIVESLQDFDLDGASLLREGRLVIFDAEDLYRRSSPGGALDAAVFQDTVGKAVAGVRASCASTKARVHAWGELVDVLWKRGELPVALRLESIWNAVIDREEVRLLCSYHMDNLAPDTHNGLLRQVCASHAQLVPERDHRALDAALREALVEVFGEHEAAMERARLAAQRTLPIRMPPAQAVLVALHESQPVLAPRVLEAVRSRMLSMTG